MDFKPPLSTQGFLQSTKFGSLIVGPVGSTKTTAGVMKIAYMAKQMAACEDGVRRSRAMWIRNTSQMLKDSSLPDFLKMFPENVAGSFKRTELKFMLRFDDVECEVWFRGLDDADDVRRVLSTQISFAIMDEFREINPDIFEAVQGRLGRYPDGTMVPHRPEWGVDEKGNPIQGCVTDQGAPNDHIWGMTNPPDADSFWETFLSDPPKNFDVFIQPSGLSPEADWIHLLKSGYYENLAEGKSQDYIDVYIHGKFGKSLQGQPVFRCFDRETHVAKDAINMGDGPLIIGVDAGLNPTAVITQQTYDGRIVVLDALTGADGGMGALRFIRERLKPLLLNKYSGKTHHLVIDPAASQRAQTDERSVADIFKTEGFSVKPAKTNSIAARIAAVESYLTRTVNGNAGMLVDPACKELIAALRSKYRYRINAKGVVDDKPEKSHPASDYADALQYACLHHDNGGLFGATLNASTKREIKRASATGWT